VNIDQGAVPHDFALSRVDESHSAHVGGQLVNLSRSPGNRGLAVFRLSQIEEQEFIGLTGREFRALDIHATHPVTFSFQSFYEMTPDEPTRAADNSLLHF